jgi:hypothetical protein
MPEQPSQRSAHWGRRIAVGLLLLTALVAIGRQLWIAWPKSTRDQFVADVSAGRFQDASGVLQDPSAIRLHENGDVTFTAKDGSTATLSKHDLPLLPLDAFYSRPATDGLMDFFEGRYRFGVHTAGDAVQRERTEPIEIQMDAVRGAISIVKVIQH